MAESGRTGEYLLKTADPVFEWGLFFKTAADPKSQSLIEKLSEENKGIRMSKALLDRLTEDDYAQARIFERERILMDYKSDMTRAKREGIEEGKLETARAMKLEGFTTEQIVKITGLETVQIEAL
jgi:predicted transposase/invertase (TIGR01784 family)